MARDRHPSPRDANRLPTAQVLGAVLLAPAVGMFLAMALAAFVPASQENRIFIGGLLVPIAWVGAMVWGVLSRTPLRCWCGLALVLVVSLGVVVADAILR